jgi:hypothetical protein
MTLPSQLGREDWGPSHWAWVNGLDETRLPQKQRLLALSLIAVSIFFTAAISQTGCGTPQYDSLPDTFLLFLCQVRLINYY